MGDITDSEIVNCAAQFDSVVVGDKDGEKCSEKLNVKPLHADETKASHGKNGFNGFKNPVKDNFEFQLLESYRCQG